MEEYHLIVYKSKKIMELRKDNILIKTYNVALGKGGNGNKNKQGDEVTPVGAYRIVRMNDQSKYHFFMQLNYPNILDAWYGYDNELIGLEDFKRIITSYQKREIPPQDTPLGGFIGIHGIGETTEEKLNIHKMSNWTDGCVAVTNEEMNELLLYVKIGTPVMIYN